MLEGIPLQALSGYTAPPKMDLREALFGPQYAAYTSPHPRVAIHTGRRGGKTGGFVRKAVEVMERHPGCRIPYIALTRLSAKGILWQTVREVNEAQGLGLTGIQSELIWRHANGAELFLIGASRWEDIEKLRGQAFPLAGIDEAGAFRDALLRMLVDDVLTWCMVDYAGQIYLLGTPPRSCAGFFRAACTGEEPGWDAHHWTCLDNPHLPGAEAFLAELRDKRGWTETSPQYLREGLGQFVSDPTLRVYDYAPDRNASLPLPASYEMDPQRWVHVMGVDYGYVDSCAWVVLAFEREKRAKKRTIYVVHSHRADTAMGEGLLPDEAARRTHELYEQYRPAVLVGDAGGLGKPYVEEARRRWKLPIQAADKAGKLASIELVNTAFRTAELQVPNPEAHADLVEELERTMWAEAKRATGGGMVDHLDRKIDEAFPDHLGDALRYAYKAAWNYVQAPEEPEVVSARRERERDRRNGEDSPPKRRKAANPAWLG